MGHSDAFPLREIDAADHPAAHGLDGRDNGVQVWGDTSRDRSQVLAATDPVPAADAAGAPDGAGSTDATDGLYAQIGHLTRTLHDALLALGYQESLADARDNLPDARDRLEYIARLTGDAAEKVLNSVDRARALQDDMAAISQGLQARWSAVGAYAARGERATPAGTALIDETRGFLAGLGDQAAQTNAILTDIMMAQDFHDLTGQVIRKVVTLAQTLEEQLVKLLIDATPEDQRKKVVVDALEGPVVNPENRTDVVTDQAGVDDLLASLGF